MKEIYFIDDAYMIRFSWLNGSTDQDYLKPAIRLAQLKRLRYYIGTCLYTKLTDLVESQDVGDNTSINHADNAKYKTILDNHIQDVLLYWTLVELYRYLVYKIDNSSILKRVANNTETLSKEELMQMIESEESNAQFFTQRMMTYLANLKGDDRIAEYDNCSEGADIEAPKTSVEWIGIDVL